VADEIEANATLFTVFLFPVVNLNARRRNLPTSHVDRLALFRSATALPTWLLQKCRKVLKRQM
jgi:hypothetical protein